MKFTQDEILFSGRDMDTMINGTTDPLKSMMSMASQTDDMFYWPDEDENVELELQKASSLTKDMKSYLVSIKSVTRSEIRTLVNLFYQTQDNRKAIREQIRAIEQGRASGLKDPDGQTQAEFKSDEDIAILNWTLKNMTVIENGLRASLKFIVESRTEGRWLLDIVGVGPVLAAGLMGFLDITKANYGANFASYAGLNDNNRPWLGKEKSRIIVNDIVGDAKQITDEMVIEISAKTQWSYAYLTKWAYDQDKKKWSKEKLISACAKVPYNRELKTHMWKVAMSINYKKNHPDSVYGKILADKQALIIKENEELKYKDYCLEKAAELRKKGKYDRAKKYEEGKLPPGHIALRAYRYMEKIFINHVFEEMYRVYYDRRPPIPYALEKLGEEHNVYIEPEVPFTLVSSEL